MAKKDKAPRMTPFTARELIVELSKCDPSAQVHFVDPSRFPTPIYPVLVVDRTARDFASGAAIVALRAKEAE